MDRKRKVMMGNNVVSTKKRLALEAWPPIIKVLEKKALLWLYTLYSPSTQQPETCLEMLFKHLQLLLLPLLSRLCLTVETQRYSSYRQEIPSM